MAKRILRFTLRALLALLGITVAVYGLFLLANLEDSPPSAAARKAHALWDARPAVSDTDNAYLFLMGLDAPLDETPLAAGLRTLEWERRVAASSDPEFQQSPPFETIDLRATRDAERQTLIDTCSTGSKPCLETLERNPDAISRWATDEAWLLERYRSLIALPHWRNPGIFDVRLPFPPFGTAAAAQKLLLITAWSRAAAAPEEARALLDQDLRFWRMALAESESLIGKMVATAAVARHFTLGNLVLRRLPAGTPPASWEESLRPEERSMERAFAGEALGFESLITQWKTNPAMQEMMAPETDGDALIATLWPIFSQLLLTQETANLQADRLDEVATALNTPYPEVPGTLARLNAGAPRPASGITLRNPIGRLAFDLATENGFPLYAARVADLEGIRRAAVATSALRNRGVPPDQAADALAESEQRNPYDGTPFVWDADEQAVVFEGVGPQHQRRQAFLY